MGIANVVDIFMGAINKAARGDLSAYSILETGNGQVLLCTDGSAATIIRYNGTVSLGGKSDLAQMAESAAVSLATFFSRPGHAIQTYYYRDPDRSAEVIAEAILPTRNTARKMGMDLDSMFDEDIGNLAKYVAEEEVYFVLWTRPGVLAKAEQKVVDKARAAPDWWPVAKDTQQLHTVSDRILAHHRAFVKTFYQNLRDLKMSLEIVKVSDAVRYIRGSLYPGYGHAGFQPYLPGSIGKKEDGSPYLPNPRMPGEQTDAEDYGYLLWPSLNSQIFDKSATIYGDKVEIGDRLFAPIDLVMGQQTQTWFNGLIGQVSGQPGMGDDMPWRVSFLIEGDGLGGVGFMTMLASIVGVTAKTNNKLYTDAFATLSQYKATEGAVVRMRVSFATWGPKTDIDLVEARANKLQRSIEAWGFTQTSTAMGDPVDGLMSSVLGLNVMSTGKPGFPPLEDALYMLPLMRDASPFKEGDVILHTRDGRIWPVQIASAQHNSFVGLVYGPSGSGKSVFLNTRNLGYCLSARAATAGTEVQIPLLGIIEIGESSKGLISTLQDSLPVNRKHEVIFHRLRMLSRDAINPFDTQLGLRKPLTMERTFLINLLSTLLTPVSEKPQVPENITEVCGQVVDMIYERFSDRSGNRSKPRAYSPHENIVVDRAIEKLGLTLPRNASWWSIVDMFFERGAIHEATIAQRYAVPRLEDLTSVRSDEKLRIWEDAKMPATGESVLSYFERMVNVATSEYPIFNNATQIDFGAAKVISIDLSEVAKSGSPAAEKMAAITYMLARYVIARTYQLHPEDLVDVPDLYASYWRTTVTRILEQPKRLVMDEFHRTAAAPAVRRQTIVDMREGRKYNMQIELASQMLHDFDKDMISLASENWILGRGDKQDADLAARTFNLSSEAAHVIWNDLKGGGPMLVVMQLKTDRHEHLVYNTLGPQKAWAFSTSSADTTLRTIMYERLGPVEARRQLGIRFPKGNAKDEIERRINQAAKLTTTGFDPTAAEMGIIAGLADEIIKGMRM